MTTVVLSLLPEIGLPSSARQDARAESGKLDIPFEFLVTALLERTTGESAIGEGTSRSPRIGDDATAFVEAALPVRTAIDWKPEEFTGRNVLPLGKPHNGKADNQSLRETSYTDYAGRSDIQNWEDITQSVRSSTHSRIWTQQQMLQDWADPGDASISGERRASSALSQSAPPTQGKTPRAATPIEPSITKRPGQISDQHIQPERERQMAVRVAPYMSSPAAGSFSAQVVNAESGLRLILRFFRLSDDDQTELEARLHCLLGEFGQRSAECLIHQPAKRQDMPWTLSRSTA